MKELISSKLWNQKLGHVRLPGGNGNGLGFESNLNSRNIVRVRKKKFTLFFTGTMASEHTLIVFTKKKNYEFWCKYALRTQNKWKKARVHKHGNPSIHQSACWVDRCLITTTQLMDGATHQRNKKVEVLRKGEKKRGENKGFCEDWQDDPPNTEIVHGMLSPGGTEGWV